MSKIRVLICDDSVVVRKLVGDAVGGDPMLEVVGVAANGRVGLSRVAQLTPDVVVLDVEMPDMDGLAALTELRRTHPKLPVIMFSSQTERGAATTLDALNRGANDYVTKPTSVANVAAAMQHVRDELLPRIKIFARRPEATAGLVAPKPRSARSILRIQREAASRQIGVVGIGALTELLAALPLELPVPIVVTQHMPPTFTRLLAEGLAAKTGYPVFEAMNGDPVEPGVVLIAPGDHHLTFARTRGGVVVRLSQQPPENCCRPAVDVMFRSLAETYPGEALGVVLTGMGKDGLRGAEAIHAARGVVFAQDEETSVVWGMPGFVANAGLAHRVLPLHRMADAVAAAVAVGRVRQPAGTGGA
jgi:two-component system, chemotaxis family, protein-glutamate methylesterase/glutaminase